MKIAFFAQNSPKMYSGGRYHSWIMAEALSHANHKVFYVTNNKPIFVGDFSSYTKHNDICLCQSHNFSENLPQENIDIVVLIPSNDLNPFFYIKTLQFCKKKRAHLILLNFETPNWYNTLSPIRRPSYYWDHWNRVSKFSSLILSSAKESEIYARQFFKDCPRTTQFTFCYPAINSIAARSIQYTKKEKRIILIARFSKNAHHKGAFELPKIICKAMQGYTLVVLIGCGNIEEDILDELLCATRKHGVHFEIKYRLTDREKFKEIKRASLMLFPSFFEGFGYPPVESQYCETPCIAFDLPVLREVSGKGLIYVEPGNWSMFREKIKGALQNGNRAGHLHDNIKKAASFSNYSKKLDHIFTNILTPEADQFRLTNNFKPARFFLASVPNLIRSYFAQIGTDFVYLGLAFLNLVYSIAIQPLLIVIRPPVRKKLMQLYPEMSWNNLARDLMILLKKKMRQRSFHS